MGHDIFEGHDGAPLDTPLCGAGPKIEWAGAEHEKKYGGAGAESPKLLPELAPRRNTNTII